MSAVGLAGQRVLEDSRRLRELPLVRQYESQVFGEAGTAPRYMDRLAQQFLRLFVVPPFMANRVAKSE